MAQLPFNGSVWINVDSTLRQHDNYLSYETEKLGLDVLEWYMLQALYIKDGPMAYQLAHEVGRAATSFTPILDKLIGKGFIERANHPSDRRAVLIKLTAKGQLLRDEVTQLADRIEAQLQQRFSPREWQGFINVLAALQRVDS